jgi:hypothetical protein
MQVVDSEGYLKVKLVGGPVGPFVPYTGATANVDLGEYEIKAGQLELDQTPTGTAGVAVMRWNDQDGTADLGLKGGNVTLQVGQEQVTRVVNKTGVNLLEANYQAVRVDGAQGNRLKVALAQANNDANSADTLGLVTETINNNQEGFVTVSGLVRNINTTGSIQTETWLDGDVLYLSGTVAGQITNVKPTAPIHTVIMGYVVRAHATQGQIYVKVDNGYELDELHNVAIVTPLNDQVLQYETATSLWKNKTISTGITIGTTAITSGTVGRVLFEGTGNVVQESANLFWDNTNGRLGIGTSSPAYKLNVVGSAGFDNGASGDAITLLNSGFIQSSLIRFRGFSAQFVIQDNSYNTKFVVSTSGSMSYFNTGGNVGINTTTDAGFRLDVNGTARVQGNLTLNGRYTFYASTGLFATTNNGLTSNSSSGNLFLGYYAVGDLSYQGTTITLGRLSNVNLTSSTGLQEMVRVTGNFAPTSGTALFTALQLSNTINQTGGANGITRGLYVNPTLTASTDFRAIETTSGNVIFNGGNVGIGTSSPVVKYHQSQTQGIFARYDITNANADQNRGVFEFYTNTAVTPDFFGRFGFKFEGGINNASRQFQLHVGDNTTPRFVVNGSGNVLINTTTDAGYKLDVNGTARVSGDMTIATASGATLTLQSNNSNIVWTGGAFGIYFNTTRLVRFGNDGTIKFAQNIIVAGTTNFTIDSSAILQAESTTKGFLPPRMTTTQKNAIASPAAGLMVYDITLNRPCFYDGTTWITL